MRSFNLHSLHSFVLYNCSILLFASSIGETLDHTLTHMQEVDGPLVQIVIFFVSLCSQMIKRQPILNQPFQWAFAAACLQVSRHFSEEFSSFSQSSCTQHRRAINNLSYTSLV